MRGIPAFLYVKTPVLTHITVIDFCLQQLFHFGIAVESSGRISGLIMDFIF